MIINIRKNRVGPSQPCFIIAEAGVNHNGDIDLAKKLIIEAAKSGADAVKFQTFKAEQVTTKHSPTAAYQKKNVGEDNQWALLRPLELDESAYSELIAECQKNNILFMSTPHGHIESAEFLKDKVPAWKVGSGDLTNLPFLRYLGETKMPIILSTGMATIAEIKEAVETIEKTGNKQLIILQCTTNYPCPDEEANVAAMLNIQTNFPDYPIGFSDHTLGIDACVLAVVMGATILEKHFTLDRNMPGPDQKNSAEPSELAELVRKVREIQGMSGDEKQELISKMPRAKTLLGSDKKVPLPSELVIAEMARKAVIATTDIPIGTTITSDMLTIKRPQKGGLPPKMIDEIIGKTAAKDIEADTQLKPEDF
jgi:N-acetylneuraminate synthase/N,N'-diacetyllegionaminate synthase